MLSFSNNLTSVSVYYELHDLFVSHHKASIEVIIDIGKRIKFMCFPRTTVYGKFYLSFIEGVMVVQAAC